MADLSALRDRIRERGLLAAGLAGLLFVERLQAAAPVDTGELRDSITLRAEPSYTGDVATVDVDVGAPHGRYQNDGTGIYGPKGSRIEGNPLLAFEWKGVKVIVHSVAGSPATHWWDNTATAETWRECVAAGLAAAS